MDWDYEGKEGKGGAGMSEHTPGALEVTCPVTGEECRVASLETAIRRLQRWVGKGIADGAYDDCVSGPEGAQRDLDFSQEKLGGEAL